MNITIWMVIALVSFILPAVSLTSGGKTTPNRGKLAKYAQSVGLPLPDPMVDPVIERVKRRQRGMVTGGITGLVIAMILFIIFADNNDSWAGVIVILFSATGTAFGSAWAIASHRPSHEAARPVVARPRQVTLADYLTRGERIGFWIIPATTVAGAIAGIAILWQLPATQRFGVGLVGAGLTLLMWFVAAFALRQVLVAPARSESNLELAWDDAERADGLRQVVNLTVATACLSLLIWLAFIAEVLTGDGFYRDNLTLSYAITGVSLLVYIPLVVATASGSVFAWASGRRKGYEQRQLWPNGVSA